MNNTEHSIKGFAAATVAFVSCPCHLPLTLPLVLTITAGTALGGWLAHNSLIVYIASTLLFVGGLFFAGRWLMVDKKEVCQVDLKDNQLKT